MRFAYAGSRKHLQQACDTWRKYDAAPDAKNSSTIAIKLWHIRPCESYRCPSFLKLTSYALGTADALARLARGTGVALNRSWRLQTADERRRL